MSWVISFSFQHHGNNINNKKTKQNRIVTFISYTSVSIRSNLQLLLLTHSHCTPYHPTALNGERTPFVVKIEIDKSVRMSNSYKLINIKLRRSSCNKETDKHLKSVSALWARQLCKGPNERKHSPEKLHCYWCVSPAGNLSTATVKVNTGRGFRWSCDIFPLASSSSCMFL